MIDILAGVRDGLLALTAVAAAAIAAALLSAIVSCFY